MSVFRRPSVFVSFLPVQNNAFAPENGHRFMRFQLFSTLKQSRILHFHPPTLYNVFKTTRIHQSTEKAMRFKSPNPFPKSLFSSTFCRFSKEDRLKPQGAALLGIYGESMPLGSPDPDPVAEQNMYDPFSDLVCKVHSHNRILDQND